MVILGIDPGLEVTGYGLIETKNGSGVKLIEAGLIRTQSTQALSQRLFSVSQQLEELLHQHRPDWMVVEDIYSHYKTPKPAILMGHVRGVVFYQAALSKVPVTSYLPTRVKKAVVGQGHAPKGQVARMVQVRLGLENKSVPSDVTDALAVALCHIDRLRMKS